MQAKHQPTDEDAPLARHTRCREPHTQPPRLRIAAPLGSIRWPVRTYFPFSLTRVPHAPPSCTVSALHSRRRLRCLRAPPSHTGWRHPRRPHARRHPHAPPLHAAVARRLSRVAARRRRHPMADERRAALTRHRPRRRRRRASPRAAACRLSAPPCPAQLPYLALPARAGRPHAPPLHIAVARRLSCAATRRRRRPMADECRP
jgi:hypothetical protein|mmetsp:Transcript_68166/g.186833  ORF Transcript_68166/g.186833 Transcript_68166/m.186833 type:complete len:203 (+) Transcript_68166:49-657(+)